MTRATETRREQGKALPPPAPGWLVRVLGPRPWRPAPKPILNLNRIRRIAYL